LRILREPKVYLVGRPSIVEEGLEAFLTDNELVWPTPTENVTSSERLVEIGGRNCYMSYGKKAGSKTNKKYIQNLIGINEDGTHKPGPAHGSVCEHPTWNFLVTGIGKACCYDEETEVLTVEGWKKWRDITDNDIFFTKNNNNEIEYQKSTKIIKELYQGEMIRVHSSRVDILVTPNHRMYCKLMNRKGFGIYTANEVYGKRAKFQRNSEKFKGELPEFFELEPVISSQICANKYGSYNEREIICKSCKIPSHIFAKFLGYWLAEGHLDHSSGSYNAVLSQNDDSKYYEDIINTVKGMGFPYCIYKSGIRNCKQIKISCGKTLYKFLEPMNGAKNKHIPDIIKQWDSSLLQLIIDCHLYGDGSFTKRGSGEAHTISYRLAGDLQELALKCGYSASIQTYDRTKEPPRMLDEHLISHKNISYVTSYSKKRNTPTVNNHNRQQYSKEPYNGFVYCATVPNGILYVRRNGKPVWCGNSQEQERHRVGWAYSELSTRYCDFEREKEDGTWEPGFCVPPLGQLSESTRSLFEKKFRSDQQWYCEILSSIEIDLKNNGEFGARLCDYSEKEKARILRKAARGAARDILPIGIESILMMSGNARTIWNCIGLRATEHAEAVIRNVYVQIARIMEKEMPSLFNGLVYKKCWDGSEVVELPRDKL